MSRGLASEGTSFAEMVNDVRRELAEHYLRGDQLKLNEITHALGFVDPSNFYRSCKRWFAPPAESA